MRWITLTIALTTLGANVTTAQSDEDAVLTAVQQFFDAMASGDSAAMRSVVVPEGRYFSVRDTPDGPAIGGATNADMLALIATTEQQFLERMWEPVVSLHGGIATVWTEYDFHENGRFSHCGVDAFSLIRTTEGWKIAAIVYTVKPEGCEPSPLGPPDL